MATNGYIWDEWPDSDDEKPPPYPAKESLPYPPTFAKPSTSSPSSLKLENARSQKPPLPQIEKYNPSQPSPATDFPPSRSDFTVMSERSSRSTAANLEKELEIYAHDDYSSIGFESLPHPHSSKFSAPLSALTASPSTKFSLRPSLAPSYSEMMKRASPSSAASATSILDELKQKLSRIQTNIQDISTKNRSLKTELVRLQTSKERKSSKLTSNYEGRLQQLSTDHQASLQQLLVFQQKVLSDIKSLKQKYTDLERKVNEVQLKKTTLLPTLQQEQQRKKQKFLRSLEAEETAFFEKQFQSKYEQQYKERQTVEYFTPKLQEWMSTNKEELSKKRQDLEHLLETTRLSLQQQQNSHLLEYKQKLQQEKDQELEKLRVQEERAWKEFVEKHEKELSQLHESYFENEKRKIMANYDLTQQNEFSFHQKTLETIMSKENAVLSELIEQQKQEMNSLVAQKAALFQSYSQDLEQEKEAFLLSLSHQHEQQELAAVDGLQRKIVNYFALSTQEILLKLSSEYSHKREQLQLQYDQQIEQSRDKSEKKLQLLKENEEKSLTRMVALKAEVETLDEELRQLGSDPKYLVKKIAQQKDKLRELREELHEKEEKSDSLAETLLELQAGEERRLKQEVESLKAALDAHCLLKQEKESLHASERRRVEEEYEMELTRIRQKISLVLEKKEKTIDQCRRELHDLQRMNRDSEEQLEEARKKSLLG